MSDLWTFNSSAWTLLGGSSGTQDGYVNEVAFQKAAYDYAYGPSPGASKKWPAKPAPPWPLARAFGNAVGISGTSSAFLFGGLLATRVPSLVGTGVPAAVACGNGGMTYIPLNDLWFLDGDSEFWPSLHAGRYNYSSRVLIGQLSGNLEYEELHFAHAAGRFAPWVPVRQPGLPLNAPSVARWPGGRAGHAMWTDSAGQLFVFGGIGPVDMPSRIEEAARNPDAFNLEERLPGYCQNSAELWRFGSSSLASGGSVRVTAAGLLGMEWTKMNVVTRTVAGRHLHPYTELFGSGPALQDDDGFLANAAPCAKLVVPGCDLQDMERVGWGGDSDRSGNAPLELPASWTPGAEAAVWSDGNTAWVMGGAVLQGAVSAESVPGGWAPAAIKDTAMSTLLSSLWSLEPAAEIIRSNTGEFVNVSKGNANDGGDSSSSVLLLTEETVVLRVESRQQDSRLKAASASKSAAAGSLPMSRNWPGAAMLPNALHDANDTRLHEGVKHASPPARLGSNVWTMADGSVAVLGGQCSVEREMGWGWGESTEVAVADMDCEAGKWVGRGTSLADCAAACANNRYFVRVDGNDDSDLNCKCCTGFPDMALTGFSSGFNVYRNGDSPTVFSGRPEVAVAGMECTDDSSSDWIGQGTDLETCAASCRTYDYFSRVDGGDLNCKCCTAPLNAGTLSAASDTARLTNVYRTVYGSAVGRVQQRCDSNDLWVRSLEQQR